MTSSGLPLPVEHCVELPVRLIESGPAAGVLAAREIAARNCDGNGEAGTVLAYDMGGTTAKGSFLVGGRVEVKPGLEVAREGAFAAGSGFPLYIPAIDLIEIGAGGGSIAEIDDRGTIAVGPRSAGAKPGPACYDQGGESATATDANLVLGLLGEVNFRNSGIQAKTVAACDAIERTIARPLGLSVERAAMGIHRTINENVARAFRVHAAELGIDYRRSVLVCTGGSAPIHAAAVARLLYIDRIIYPFAAGVASAFGDASTSVASACGVGAASEPMIVVLARSRNFRHQHVGQAWRGRRGGRRRARPRARAATRRGTGGAAPWPPTRPPPLC